MRSLRATLLAALLVAPLGCNGSDREGLNEPEVITVFAAASLTEAMTDAAAAYESSTGVDVRLSFGASSTLARQIEEGAPADLYAAADPAWMDHLAERGLIDADSRRDMLTNRLVLISSRDVGDEPTGRIGSDFDLPSLVDGLLAVADPSHVPAGRYAKQALQHFGWWQSLEVRLATATDVKAALRLVQLRECNYGIVYQTDPRSATEDGSVRIAGVFPENSHDPIVYPFALTNDAPRKAERFLDFLASPEGAAIFERYGFETK